MPTTKKAKTPKKKPSAPKKRKAEKPPSTITPNENKHFKTSLKETLVDEDGNTVDKKTQENMSKSNFDNKFLSEFASSKKQLSKYPLKESTDIITNIIQHKSNKNIELSNETKNLFMSKFKFVPDKILNDLKKKYSIATKSKAKNLVCIKTNKKVCFFEDLFSAIYTEHVKANHNNKLIKAEIYKKYANIPDNFLVWFRRNVCIV